MKIDNLEPKEIMQGRIEFNPGQESYRCSACQLSIKSGNYVYYQNGTIQHRKCAVKLGVLRVEQPQEIIAEKPEKPISTIAKSSQKKKKTK